MGHNRLHIILIMSLSLSSFFPPYGLTTWPFLISDDGHEGMKYNALAPRQPTSVLLLPRELPFFNDGSLELQDILQQDDLCLHSGAESGSEGPWGLEISTSKAERNSGVLGGGLQERDPGGTQRR